MTAIGILAPRLPLWLQIAKQQERGDGIPVPAAAGGNKRQHYAISPPFLSCVTESYKYNQQGSNRVKCKGGMLMGQASSVAARLRRLWFVSRGWDSVCMWVYVSGAVWSYLHLRASRRPPELPVTWSPDCRHTLNSTLAIPATLSLKFNTTCEK